MKPSCIFRRGASVAGLVWLAFIGCARSKSVGAPAPASIVEAPVEPAFIGAGSLEGWSPTHPKSNLTLKRLSVKAETTGDVAEVTVEHVFASNADERLEGTFRFPLPAGAMLTGLAMEIDGKLAEGELVERDKARKAYEDTVDHMLDPALLEWESGTTFKMRVFPIAPRETKRVVIRFVAPLYRAKGGLAFAFRPPTADGGARIEHLSIVVDGRDVTNSERGPTGEVLVHVADSVAEAFAEHTPKGTYVTVGVHPSFAATASSSNAAVSKQALVVLCDRSRSMLEARNLETQVVGDILTGLGQADRFAVVTGDVRARVMPTGGRASAEAGMLHAPTDAEKLAAAAFVDGVEPDGASDVGALLAAGARVAAEARAEGLTPVFAYVGDATATWGETRASELARQAQEALGGAPLHVVVLGRSTDESAARALASATHGRVLHPHTRDEGQRAAALVLASRSLGRIDDLKIVADESVDVPEAPPSTVYDGDAIAFTAFVPKDKEESVKTLRLVGQMGDKPYEKEIDVTRIAAARDVSKRYAKARIEALERDGDAHKDDVIATSLALGVMSRYTSLLVLESDEAYAKYRIERRAAQEAVANGDSTGETRVSGRDLGAASDTGSASVTPDHLQPGDPEIRIPAPADAQSVVVVFPFGETKNAVWEGDAHGGSWVARFLVDAHTPDGTYDIVVRITHADGRVEILTVPYVVDTLRPTMDVSVTRRPGGRYAIRARQRLTPDEIAARATDLGGRTEETSARAVQVLTDAKRVEVMTPDGQTLSLVAIKLGDFVGTWTPEGPVAEHARLRLVAVDRALNERVMEVEVP